MLPDTTGSGKGSLTSSCEHGNENFGYIKWRKSLYQLNENNCFKYSTS